MLQPYILFVTSSGSLIRVRVEIARAVGMGVCVVAFGCEMDEVFDEEKTEFIQVSWMKKIRRQKPNRGCKGLALTAFGEFRANCQE